MRRRSRRSPAPTRSSVRTTRTSTAAPAAAATRRASPRPRRFRICWRATSTSPRAAQRMRPPAAAAARSRAADPGLRNDAVAADIDPRGFERPVRLFHRVDDIDAGARLELALLPELVADDRRARRHDELLLAVLVLHGDDLPVDARDRRGGGAVGHGAVRRPVPWTMTLAETALRVGENVHLDRLLAAVGLRHRAAADVGALLDVGERSLHHADDLHVAGERDGEHGAVARLHRERIALDLLDRPAHPLGLRLLRDGRRNRERRGQHDRARRRSATPASHRPAHALPPKIGAYRRGGTHETKHRLPRTASSRRAATSDRTRLALPSTRPRSTRLRSHRRRDAVAADRDGGGFQRAVVLLLGSGDEDLGARLELVLGPGNVGHD